ncbi:MULTISPECIES: rhomboid family intramembrane serine protease [Tessaracoccus]|uniref:rhomboid family intramembrane serine protease n=1 Tax=Tessaracoccus TaxID=72763 RepID=UPI0009C1ECB6|nr:MULTISPECIES: rhomboid family intramembrane serine protease [Tessaracoccus]AQX15968.1 hypothetical protein BKM78_08590 [Tessaracoccus sp. T2.5-30]
MEEAPPTCYRHPDQPTRITCQRCERPICPSCMVPGAVGFQCPKCVSQGHRETRQLLLPYGGTRVRNPKATSVALIAVNALVWVAVLLTGGAFGTLYNLLAMVPEGLCPVGDRILLTGPAGCVAEGYSWLPGVATGAPWQVLTSGFTHAAAWHLGFNMLVLWLLGPTIEQVLGRARYLAVYLVALLGGSAGVMLLSQPYSSSVGASGAIYGLMGALLLIAIRHKGDVRGILFWLGLNVVLSFTWSGISWEGHLGGLAGGMAAAAIIMYLPKGRRGLQWPLVALLAAVFVAVIVARAMQLAP